MSHLQLVHSTESSTEDETTPNLFREEWLRQNCDIFGESAAKEIRFLLKALAQARASGPWIEFTEAPPANVTDLIVVDERGRATFGRNTRGCFAGHYPIQAAGPYDKGWDNVAYYLPVPALKQRK